VLRRNLVVGLPAIPLRWCGWGFRHIPNTRCAEQRGHKMLPLGAHELNGQRYAHGRKIIRTPLLATAVGSPGTRNEALVLTLDSSCIALSLSSLRKTAFHDALGYLGVSVQ